MKTHGRFCKWISLFSPWGFKAFLSATFVNILFLWPQLNKIKPLHFPPPNISVHSAYSSVTTRRVSGGWRRVASCRNQHAAPQQQQSAKWQKQLCIMRVMIIIIPFRTVVFGKAICSCWTEKHVPAIQRWVTGILKRQRDEGKEGGERRRPKN